jgi:hypothetical protein
MNFMHYSKKEVMFCDLEDRTKYIEDNNAGNYKPQGFWISVEGEDDWYRWCIDNDYGLESLTHQHEVKLKDDAEILIIDSTDKLKKFNSYYITRNQLEKCSKRF